MALFCFPFHMSSQYADLCVRDMRILCKHVSFRLQSHFFCVRNPPKIILYVRDEWAVAHFFFPVRHRKDDDRRYAHISGKDTGAYRART